MIGFRARLLTSVAYAHNVESHELAKYCAPEQEFNRNPAADRYVKIWEVYNKDIKMADYWNYIQTFYFERT